MNLKCIRMKKIGFLCMHSKTRLSLFIFLCYPNTRKKTFKYCSTQCLLQIRIINFQNWVGEKIIGEEKSSGVQKNISRA